MIDNRLFAVMALAAVLATGAEMAAQVQTEVPPVVPGAKPVTVEHIRVHGTALEGNLEGDAVDRDVLVFLPPSYQKDEHRRYPVVYALHGYSSASFLLLTSVTLPIIVFRSTGPVPHVGNCLTCIGTRDPPAESEGVQDESSESVRIVG